MPSSMVCAPAVGNSAPVVKPSICAASSPASAMARRAVSSAMRAERRGACRCTWLCA